MRLSCLPYSSVLFHIYILSLLEHSQVRSATLNGYVTIWAGGSPEYENLNSCQQECLWYNIVDKDGLNDVLSCGAPAANACYCRSDKLQLAASVISSCVTRECQYVDVTDISTTIAVYTDYCSGVSQEAYVAATTAGGTAASSNGMSISFRTVQVLHHSVGCSL